MLRSSRQTVFPISRTISFQPARPQTPLLLTLPFRHFSSTIPRTQDSSSASNSDADANTDSTERPIRRKFDRSRLQQPDPSRAWLKWGFFTHIPPPPESAFRDEKEYLRWFGKEIWAPWGGHRPRLDTMAQRYFVLKGHENSPLPRILARFETFEAMAKAWHAFPGQMVIQPTLFPLVHPFTTTLRINHVPRGITKDEMARNFPYLSFPRLLYHRTQRYSNDLNQVAVVWECKNNEEVTLAMKHGAVGSGKGIWRVSCMGTAKQILRGLDEAKPKEGEEGESKTDSLEAFVKGEGKENDKGEGDSSNPLLEYLSGRAARDSNH
ncbi:hypothetical protein BT69DRAFT_1275713 [Atractiella rhizophila]|nr:hypothetical protein BT69DRAFT_1275713 [Atractiella rhizophila]